MLRGKKPIAPDHSWSAGAPAFPARLAAEPNNALWAACGCRGGVPRLEPSLPVTNKLNHAAPDFMGEVEAIQFLW